MQLLDGRKEELQSYQFLLSCCCDRQLLVSPYEIARQIYEVLRAQDVPRDRLLSQQMQLDRAVARMFENYGDPQQ